MFDWVSYNAAFVMGLLGGTHCIGMCGGLMGALSFALEDDEPRKAPSLRLLLGFNLGRIMSYVTIGIIVGGVIEIFDIELFGFFMRSIAALLLILMGLYIAGWWHGLRHIEYLGQFAWRYIKPLSKRLLPVRSFPHAVLFGGVWGWMPCGLVYSVLIWAVAQQSMLQAALIMLCFGLGTLPILLTAGIFTQQLKRLIQHRFTRSVAALGVISFGVFTLPWWHLLAHDPAAHDAPHAVMTMDHH
ncbi:MAG: sulfite exporter TauE/SafE family protein [Pseudomonadales bacterium]